MDIEKEKEAFQKFWEENFDFENHEYTYFDEKNQCYENDSGEDTESINMAWAAWQTAKAQAVPEGFVQVPIKLPEDAIYSLARKCFEEGQSTWNKFGQFNESNKERWIQNEMNIIKNLHIDFLRTFKSL